MNHSLDVVRRCFQPRQWSSEDGEPDPFTINDQDAFMWVYRIISERFAVGYYAPDGTWFSESEYDERDKASARVNYLNGGKS